MSSLQLREIGPGWTRYKSEAPIEPGRYYQFVGRPDKATTTRFGAIAASGPHTYGMSGQVVSSRREFCWLVPAERWVKAVSDRFIPPECQLCGQSPDLVDREYRELLGSAWDSMRPHQHQAFADAVAVLKRGVSFRRGLIWSLGGGKTLAGLALCQLGDRPVVLAPRYVHGTWLDEAKKWGLQAPTVLTYESAHKAVNPDVVIADEALMVKSPDTLRHGVVADLCRGASISVGMTGTPTGGRGPLDWRWLRAIVPGSVPENENTWRHLYGLDTRLVEVKPGQKAWVTNQWDLGRVNQLVGHYCHTVDTASLLAHLPPIEYRTLTVAKPRDYESVRAGIATERTKAKRVAQCRQCADGFVQNDLGEVIPLSSEKVNAVVEFVENLGEPVVIYAAWRGTIDKLRAAFPTAAVIEGGSSDVSGEIARFTSGMTDVLIANSAFAEGMNLQSRCRVMVYVSPSLNPTKLTQGVGRVYRPGQSRGVIVVRVVAEGTLDARTWELIEGHNGLSEAGVAKLLEDEI